MTPTDGDTARVLGAWVNGWAVSRAVGAPAAVPGGWRLRVGLPGHRVRYVLTTCDRGVMAAVGPASAAPGTWVKVAGEARSLRAALPGAWEMADTGQLMTTTFASSHEPPPAPSRYRTEVVSIGEVIVATIVEDDGDVAASGRLAHAGGVGVVDQVETTRRHRRRGLGTAIMKTLSHHAVHLGLREGVLVATDSGRDLYRTLGWTSRLPVAAAFLPEDEQGPA